MIRNTLLLLCIAAGIAGVATADAGPTGGATQLTGVWHTEITARDCVTDGVLGGPFQGLITYHAGGTVSEIGPSFPGTTRSAGHGVWRRSGPHSYVVNLIFQRYDLNGFYIGTQTIRGEPVIDIETGDYVAKGTSTLHDALGAQVGAGCAQVNGRRFAQN